MRLIHPQSSQHASPVEHLGRRRLERVQKLFIDRVPMSDRLGAGPGTSYFDRSDPSFSLVWKAFRYSTNEKRELVSFLRGKIIPRLDNSMASLLDVGADDGSIAKAICGRFDRITLIEPNPTSAYGLAKGAFGRLHEGKEYRIIPVPFQTTDLGMERYDLALLSHVIYYFDPRSWVDAAAKAHHHTVHGGAVVLAYSGDNGDTAALVRRFGGTPLDFCHFEKACGDRFHNATIERYELGTVLRASSPEAMMHFSGFLLRDADCSATSSELREHVENNFKKDERYYEMKKYDTVLVIWKH